MKTWLSLLTLCLLANSYSQYEPTFTRTEMISKIDSLETFLASDSIIHTRQNSEEQPSERTTRYESGYTKREFNGYTTYTLGSPSSAYTYGVFNSNNSVEKENRQYTYFYENENNSLVVADLMFQFTKGEEKTEVSLNFVPVSEIDEGESTNVDVFISKNGTILRGTASNVPFDEPQSEASFGLNIENGEFEGQLIYNPETAKFTIQINN